MAGTKPSECQPLSPEVLGALSACLLVICLHSDRRRKPPLPRGLLLWPRKWLPHPSLSGNLLLQRSSVVGLGFLQQSPEADPADKDGVRRRGAREEGSVLVG